MKKKKYKLKELPFKLLLKGTLKSIILIVIFGVYEYIDSRPTVKYLETCKSEFSKKRVRARGCIYKVRSKRLSLYYKFLANGLEYEGWSKYSNHDGIPEEGDSIDIYYSEKDPELNLTISYYNWIIKGGRAIWR